MRYDFSVIAPHRLDVSSVTVLGKDIAQRLNVNINCYANDEYNINAEMKGNYPWYEKINLGSIILDTSLPNWFLREEFYNIKKYFRKYGDDLFDHPYFQLHPMMVNSFAEVKDVIWYQLYSGMKSDYRQGQIFSNLWECDFYNFFGWNNFYKAFEKGCNIENLNNLIAFRKKLYSTVGVFGGDKVVYFNDERDSECFIYSAMGAQNWEDFINDVKDCFGNKMYNIAELIQKNIFFENNGAPLAFFDDFSDLKCFHSKFSDVPFNISVKDIVEGLSSLGY